jgi:hypothetical protein
VRSDCVIEDEALKPLLHAVSRVTRGRRHAFLPFLYHEPASRIREANNGFLHESVGAYDSQATGRTESAPKAASAASSDPSRSRASADTCGAPG